MRAHPAACTVLVLSAGLSAPRVAHAQSAVVVLTYRAQSEDDASAGRLRLELSASRPARAVVWERACTVSARRDADAPDADVDQFWTFRIDLAKDARGRPAARVRYRLVTASGPGREQERLVVLDGKDTLALDGFSARTDCRYDRVLLSISGA
jgi:hypothetical protein